MKESGLRENCTIRLIERMEGGVSRPPSTLHAITGCQKAKGRIHQCVRATSNDENSARTVEAPGVDGAMVAELQEYLWTHWESVNEQFCLWDQQTGTGQTAGNPHTRRRGAAFGYPDRDGLFPPVRPIIDNSETIANVHVEKVETGRVGYREPRHWAFRKFCPHMANSRRGPWEKYRVMNNAHGTSYLLAGAWASQFA